MVKLHLGCGEKYIPGFIHIDFADYEHIDFQQSIGHLQQYKKNEVDLIYCCHAFEYFDRDIAKYALREWRRVLKPGGTLRLAVPDFAAICKVYQKYKDLDGRGILGPLYGKIAVKTNVLLYDSYKATHKFMYHKTAYDFESLKKMLKDAGFKNIRKWDWRKTEHSHIDDCSQAYIPHMNKKYGMLISLNVEADK